jgi:PAS domain S-box-containing protein
MPLAKILIVEDEALVAKDIQRSLEKLGYSVAAITDNGLDAINLAKQLKPDLIIMDIMLKGPMDGIDAAAKISALTKTPFVYLTAHQNDEILERSKATRPYGYMLKPLNERDLNSCLRMALYRFDTEKRLKESEERYFRLADNARDMIYRMSLVNGVYEYVNKACVNVTGYSRDDFYNTPMFILKIIHPDWQNYFKLEWSKLKKGEMAPVYEYQIISKSGEVRWLNQRNVLIKNDAGTPTAIEGIVTDISEQKKAEHLLRKQREEYRLMFEAIPAMVLVKDSDNKIIKANTLAAEFLGVTLNQLEGKYIKELFPHESDTYIAEDQTVLSTGKPLFDIIEEYNKNGRGKVWLKYDKYPYRSESGEILGVIVMAQDITEQKQTELALMQSESKYRNLTKNAPVAFTRLIVGENKYEIVNDEFEKQSGYTLEEFNNLTEEEYQNLIHHEDRTNVMSEYRQWVKDGCSGIKNLIYRIVNKYGNIVWLDSYHYADYSSEGKPVAINQLYFNINERIDSENVLRESKQYLDAFFAQSLDGIFIAKTTKPVLWNDNIDKDKALDFIFGDIKLTRVNKPLCEQFGMTEETALRVHPLEYYRGDMGPVRERWKNFLDDGYLHINEYFKKAAGENIFIEGDYYCLYDSKKNFIGYLGIQRDMTQRKIAEETIKLSEEKFRAVAEAIPAQVVIFQDSKFVYVNPYSEIITGYSAEEMLKMNFWDLVHKDYVDLAIQRGTARLKGESAPENYEMKIVTKSGEEKWINYSARVIDFNGKPAVVGISTDITENKNADEAIKKSLKEKEILLKEIHHRVKNNLQIVTSLLKLQSSYVKDESVKRLFQESQNRVQSMSLIHQKLYQTKDLAHIDFRDYIETVVTHLQHSFGILEDRVRISVDVQNIVMSIDNAIPAGLIINELVSNSLKHAFPDGGKGSIYINLAFDEFNREYWLVVRDNGIGMPDGFDIRKTNSFGLKLVSTLVSQMSGTIEIVTIGGSEYRIMFKSAEYKERN